MELTLSGRLLNANAIVDEVIGKREVTGVAFLYVSRCFIPCRIGAFCLGLLFPGSLRPGILQG